MILQNPIFIRLLQPKHTKLNTNSTKKFFDKKFVEGRHNFIFKTLQY